MLNNPKLFRWSLGGLVLLTSILLAVTPVLASSRLDGRILLQVEDKGQAWYINPLDSLRYYLGRPADAFDVMRRLGLGVSNNDVNSFSAGAPVRLSGRILLKVEDKGRAYYVDPLTLKLRYLGRPADAFDIMRQLGLGISNSDLSKIPLAASSVKTITTETKQTRIYNFKYQNYSYEISQNLSSDWYNLYKIAPKVYTYSSVSPPENIRDSFYGLFLEPKAGDSSIFQLAEKLKSIAAVNNWSQDQLAEFSLAFIQYIPYDHDKLVGSDNRNNNPYYPYETLYLDKGVCSDKTFLAVMLLRELGFGAAILDFPDSNHSAVGISCPQSESISGSGYCYGETTNYFPLGVVPSSISSGQAQVKSGFSASFDPSSLGKMEIYQASSGRQYNGITVTRQLVEKISELQFQLSSEQELIISLGQKYQTEETELNATKEQIDKYYASGQISAYNQLVPEYNAMIQVYNQGLIEYQLKVNAYNLKAAEFNQAVKDFYQK